MSNNNNNKYLIIFKDHAGSGNNSNSSFNSDNQNIKQHFLKKLSIGENRIDSFFHYTFRGLSIELNNQQLNLLKSSKSSQSDYEIYPDISIKLIDMDLVRNPEIDKIHHDYNKNKPISALNIKPRSEIKLKSNSNSTTSSSNNNNNTINYVVPWGVTEINSQPIKDLKSGEYLEMNVDADVYIIDTGISEHTNLNLVESVSFVRKRSNNINTINTTNNNNFDFENMHGHATHVAGIIGAAKIIEKNQDQQISSSSTLKLPSFHLLGVAPGVRLHSIRVLDGNGEGLMSWILEGIDFVIKRKLQNPDQTVIVNLSLGYESKTNEPTLLDKAIDRASSLGIIFVIAAGNSGRDSLMTAPAHNLNAITVGSYNKDGDYSHFSNYGVTIDVIAPGESIFSTWPKDSFATLSGTSMAAPHITGVIALLASKNKKLNVDEIMQYINKHKTKLINNIPIPIIPKNDNNNGKNKYTNDFTFQFPNNSQYFASSFIMINGIRGIQY
jgi:subtilisin